MTLKHCTYVVYIYLDLNFVGLNTNGLRVSRPCLRDFTVFRLGGLYKRFSTDREEFSSNAALEEIFRAQAFILIFSSSFCQCLDLSTSFEFSVILHVVYLVLFSP